MRKTQRADFAQIRMYTMQVMTGMTVRRHLCQLNMLMVEQKPRQFSPGIAGSADYSNALSIHLTASSGTPFNT
jgi:hypothetical protein